MPISWEVREDFFVAEATHDVTHGADVRPCLLGWRAREPLLVAFLRDCGGGYVDPLIELLALALPLGADRLAVSFSGRAWSFDDPIPPVVAGVGDLRQRVLVISSAALTGGAVRCESAVYPFGEHAGRVTWREPLREPATGWVMDVLERAILRRGELAANRTTIRRQARRCVALGHLIGFAPPVAAALRLDRVSRRS